MDDIIERISLIDIKSPRDNWILGKLRAIDNEIICRIAEGFYLAGINPYAFGEFTKKDIYDVSRCPKYKEIGFLGVTKQQPEFEIQSKVRNFLKSGFGNFFYFKEDNPADYNGFKTDYSFILVPVNNKVLGNPKQINLSLISNKNFSLQHSNGLVEIVHPD